MIFDQDAPSHAQKRHHSFLTETCGNQSLDTDVADIADISSHPDIRAYCSIGSHWGPDHRCGTQKPLCSPGPSEIPSAPRICGRVVRKFWVRSEEKVQGVTASIANHYQDCWLITMDTFRFIRLPIGSVYVAFGAYPKLKLNIHWSYYLPA